jgi:hypothetical protein
MASWYIYIYMYEMGNTMETSSFREEIWSEDYKIWNIIAKHLTVSFDV